MTETTLPPLGNCKQIKTVSQAETDRYRESSCSHFAPHTSCTGYHRDSIVIHRRLFDDRFPRAITNSKLSSRKPVCVSSIRSSVARYSSQRAEAHEAGGRIGRPAIGQSVGIARKRASVEILLYRLEDFSVPRMDWGERPNQATLPRPMSCGPSAEFPCAVGGLGLRAELAIRASSLARP